MIEQYSFGMMVVSGKIYSTDLKIINGKVVPEWWRRAGHCMDIEDLADIVEAGPNCLVVGTGAGGRMKVSEKVRRKLKDLGVDLVEEPTANAVKTFNRLYEKGENLAACFHLTC
jgi:hypothetical protein